MSWYDGLKPECPRYKLSSLRRETWCIAIALFAVFSCICTAVAIIEIAAVSTCGLMGVREGG